MLSSIIFSVILVTFAPSGTNAIDNNDINGACEEYTRVKTEYITEYDQLATLNTRAQTQYNKIKPLTDGLKAKSSDFHKKYVFSNKLNLTYIHLRTWEHAIYNNKTFENLADEMLIKGSKVFGDTQTAGSCYSTLMSDSIYLESKESSYLKTQQYLNSAEQILLHLNFVNDEFSPCVLNDVRTEAQTLLIDAESFLNTVYQHEQNLKKILNHKFSFKCDIDPLKEFDRLVPLFEKEIEPFYQKMSVALVPHFNEVKNKLHDITQAHLEYGKYWDTSVNQQSILENMNFNGLTVENVEETKDLLRKTENLLETTKSYNANDILNKLQENIKQLKEHIELCEKKNESIEKYEANITATLKDIRSLRNILPNVMDKLKKVSTDAFDFVSEIEAEAVPVGDIKDYVWRRIILNDRIDKFLNDAKTLVDITLSKVIERIKKKVSDANAKFEVLETAHTGMKAKKDNSLTINTRVKEDNTKIIDTDIPAFVKQTNIKKINDDFTFGDQIEALNDINEKKGGVLRNSTSFESRFNPNGIRSIEQGLTQARQTMSQVKRDNESFKALVSSHKTSSVGTNADKFATLFTNTIDDIEGELDLYDRKISSLKTNIESVKTRISNNEKSLNDVNARSNKLLNDYKALISANNTLTAQLTIDINEFKVLFNDKTNDLNMQVDSEVTQLKSDFRREENEVTSIGEEITSILNDISNLEQKKVDIMKKTDNMKKVHASMVESLNVGFGLNEQPDLVGFNNIKTQFLQKFNDYKDSLTTYKNGQKTSEKHYTDSISDANTKIEEINRINKNESIKRLLNGDLSTSNTFDKFNTLVKKHAESVKGSETKVDDFKTKFDQSTKEFNNDKQTFDQTMEEIDNLLKEYNTKTKEESLFLNDETVNQLVRLDSNLKGKYDEVKTKTESINGNIKELTNTNNDLVNEIDTEGPKIVSESEQIKRQKAELPSYFERLVSLKSKVEQINEATEALSSKKLKISALEKSLLSKYNSSGDLIDEASVQFSKAQPNQIELLKSVQEEVQQKYNKYVKIHQEGQNKYSAALTELPNEFEEKYNEIKAKETKMNEDLKQQLHKMTEAISKGESYYVAEKKRLNTEKSTRMTKIERTVGEIAPLLNEISSASEENIDNLINNEYSEMSKKIDEILADNQYKFTLNQYQKIHFQVPSEKVELEATIQAAIQSDKDSINTLENTKKSDNDEEEKEVEEIKEVAEEIQHETGARLMSNQPTMNGKSEQSDATDYYKIIMTLAAVSMIAMVIGGAVIRYRGMRKNEIYNKCENIYVKA